MARSSYIYVVMGATEPLAAFTVKRELLFWLLRPNRRGYRVFRVPDNAFPGRAIVDITAEVSG